MQEADKSNVVQIGDFARRRGPVAHLDWPAAGCSVAPQCNLYVFPQPHAPYPGGIDDLPV